jgi:hypothetical protein
MTFETMSQFAKYTDFQASRLAQAIAERCGPAIVVASAGSIVRPEWVAGLVGMEDPQLYEWPDKRSTRFEPGVYQHLLDVKSKWRMWKRSWGGITGPMLEGLSDDAIRNLATSWGWTQIMGYYTLTLFEGHTIAELRDPALHFNFAVQMLVSVARPWLEKGRFDQTCHIWNHGSPYKVDARGRPIIKTYSPYYMDNCGLVAQEFKKLLSGINVPMGTLIRRGEAVAGILAEDTMAEQLEQAQLVESGSIHVDEKLNFLPEMGERTTMKSSREIAQELDDRTTTAGADGLDEVETSIPGPSYRRGWKTSQGQMQGLVTVACLVLALLGFHYTPTQVAGVVNLVLHLGTILGPLVVWAWTHVNYTNSRGKIESNSLWATAQMNTPPEGLGFASNMNTARGISVGGLAGSLFGGTGLKDPATLSGLAQTIGKLAGGKTGQTIDTVTGGTQIQALTSQVQQGFEAVGEKLADHEGRIKHIEAAPHQS